LKNIIMLEEMQTPTEVLEKDKEYPGNILPESTVKEWVRMGLCKYAPEGVEVYDISRRLDKKDSDTSKHTSKAGRRKQTPGLDKS
jgi:hypothetical protein